MLLPTVKQSLPENHAVLSYGWDIEMILHIFWTLALNGDE
jgi:hypothetical protein